MSLPLTPKAPVATPGNRLAFLDGLRASAALFVLVHHAFEMAYPLGLGVWPVGAMGYALGWITYGHYGVTVFIALAGYSLALGVARRGGTLPGGFFGFMKRRAWRILPPYWAALLLTIILSVTVIGTRTGTHWDQSLPPSPIRWVVDALLLQDVFPVRSAAYTFWTIGLEWHIYLLLPFMLLVRRRSSWTKAILAGVGIAAAVLVLSRFVPRVGPVGIESLWPTYYIVFAMAVGACVAVRNESPWILALPLKTLAAASGAFIVAIGITQPYSWVSANYYWIDLIVGAAVICLISSMALGRSPRMTEGFSWKPLAGIGLFSYSMYLVHAPLLQVFWQVFVQPFGLDRPATLLVMWVGGVPMMIGASYVFYLLVEKRVPLWHAALDRRIYRSSRDAASVQESTVVPRA